MTPERWARLKSVLGDALSRPAHQRSQSVAHACADDPSLRAEAEDLLACEDAIDGFLEPAPLAQGTEADDALSVPEDLQRWSDYEELQPLGRGGMATVYKARDPRLHRLVAIKVIRDADDLTVRRFLREAEAQARVEHTHVVKIYATGLVGRHHYIAMQYVNGPTLLGVRDETTLERKVELLLQVAEGLHAAHRQGLVHRDIKPGNILVERGPDGLTSYLVDFGLAADVGSPGLTKTGVVIGTPRYMSPERIRGGTQALDRRSDVYSLGATAYEFFAGVAPFSGAGGLEVLSEILDGEFAPLRQRQSDVPVEIESIIGKCLEKDPQQRYQSARALAEDLRRYLDGDAVLARPTSAFARMAKLARKNPRAAAALTALATLTIVLSGWVAYGSWRATRQAQLAERLGQEIRDLDWLFRAAQMSPLHDITPQKQQVRERMGHLEQTMAGVGAIGFAPGQYALGRGYLTLGEHENARQHLERAWDSGYRTADAATALGLLHSELYRIGLEQAQRIESDRAREERRRALVRTHRDQALRYLEEGGTSSMVPRPYRDALVASHRGDVPAAIDRAATAARETPWLFEAQLLPAYLLFSDATQRYSEGDVTGAAAKASEADRYYGAAQLIAPSGIEGHLGRCAVAGLMLHMIGHRLVHDPRTWHQQAEDSCSRARAVEPQHADAHRLHGEALRSWAMVRVLAKADPGDAYERATRLTSRAVELSGGGVEPIVALADTLLDRAWWTNLQRGRDDLTAVDRAVATYERALSVDARNLSAIGNMGQAFLLRSRFEAARALDNVPTLERAVEAFRRALTVDASLATGYRNLATATLRLADAGALRGIDRRHVIENSIHFIEALAADPNPPTRDEALSRLRARLNQAAP